MNQYNLFNIYFVNNSIVYSFIHLYVFVYLFIYCNEQKKKIKSLEKYNLI